MNQRRDETKRLSQCLISFGSNLGTRESLIAQAAAEVASQPAVIGFRASRLFETPPIGGPDGQEPFLNAVASFETEMAARDVLEMLQQIETHLGRQRKRRWDARSIDLDVVLHGQLVGGATGLIVPHPRYTARQFVLQPACDVAPHFRDPRFGWTLERLTAHVGAGVASLSLVGGDQSIRERLCSSLESRHGIRTFAARPLSDSMAVVANAPASGGASAFTAETKDQPIEVADRERWVSAFVPRLPDLDSPETDKPNVPRLIARIQTGSPASNWPAPHQMWPSGWQWPEYRLEVDDFEWAVSELVSALDSMRCSVKPVTADGSWWH